MPQLSNISKLVRRQAASWKIAVSVFWNWFGWTIWTHWTRQRSSRQLDPWCPQKLVRWDNSISLPSKLSASAWKLASIRRRPGHQKVISSAVRLTSDRPRTKSVSQAVLCWFQDCAAPLWRNIGASVFVSCSWIPINPISCLSIYVSRLLVAT